MHGFVCLNTFIWMHIYARTWIHVLRYISTCYQLRSLNISLLVCLQIMLHKHTSLFIDSWSFSMTWDMLMSFQFGHWHWILISRNLSCDMRVTNHKLFMVVTRLIWAYVLMIIHSSAWVTKRLDLPWCQSNIMGINRLLHVIARGYW